MRVAKICSGAVAALALAVSPAALAAGGGGGGGSFESPGASLPRYDPAEEYRKGVAALQANQFKQAATALERAASGAPKDANIRLLLAMAEKGGGDLKKARKSLQRAIKLDGDLLAARRELALVALELGDAPAAEAELAALRERNTACAGACAQAGELAASIAAIEAAQSGHEGHATHQPSSLLLSPEAGDSAYLTAVALINESRYEAALAELAVAAQAFAAHPDVLTYQGFASRKLGRFEAAEQYYRAALAIAPEHRGALEYYGELKLERGDVAGAKAHLAKLEALCSFGCAEADELARWIAQKG